MYANKQNIANNPGASGVKSGRAFFQPKLTVNQPGDVYEQEADHMADRVMRMTDASVNQNAFFKPAAGYLQRKCQACEEEEKQVHRKESNGSEVQSGHELVSYVGSLNSSGQPMSEGSRKFFEPKFGHDFSNVRLHTDGVAAKSAQSINALAYTSGNNIVFNSGQYSPETGEGKKLIAHELTHVVQQGKTVESKIQKAEKKPVCNMVSAIPSAERYNFIVNTDNFIDGEENRLNDKIATIDAGTPIDVLGMASAEGPEANNQVLSCKRAHKVGDIIRGAGHTVSMEKATGGYPGSAHDKDFRAVAINYNTPAKIVCDPAPPPAPAPGTRGAPLLSNPHIPSRASCRGACGEDCPPTCTHQPDVVLCLPDSTGTCHFTYTYGHVLECGSHPGCRVHDACYDRCGPDIYDSCHRGCDLDCFEVHSISLCNGWRQGHPPFDSMILYSDPPTISGPSAGSCSP